MFNANKILHALLKLIKKNNHIKIHTYIVHQYSYEYGGLGQSTWNIQRHKRKKVECYQSVFTLS